MGTIVGCTLGIWLFSFLFEWLIFKRVCDDPVTGKVGSVIAAFVFAVVVVSITSPYGIDTYYIGYVIGACVVGAFAHRAGVRLREQLEIASEQDIFEK